MTNKILIIDDEENLTLLVSVRLESFGYDVLVANDGIRGLEIAKEEKPDLILLDLMMPGMDGVEVAKKLKENPETQNIPYFVFTAGKGDEYSEKIRNMGGIGVVPKPYEPEDIKALLENFFN